MYDRRNLVWSATNCNQARPQPIPSKLDALMIACAIVEVYICGDGFQGFPTMDPANQDHHGVIHWTPKYFAHAEERREGIPRDASKQAKMRGDSSVPLSVVRLLSLPLLG